MTVIYVLVQHDIGEGAMAAAVLLRCCTDKRSDSNIKMNLAYL
jgi:hypothetical protein